MKYTKTILSSIIASLYFYILNNPIFLKKINIKLDNNKELLKYSIIYLLLLYSTYKIVNLYYPDKIVENLSDLEEKKNKAKQEKYNDNIFGEFKKKLHKIRYKDDQLMDGITEEDDTINYCKSMEDKIINTLEDSDEEIKDLIQKMKDNPYNYDICKRNDYMKCNKLDMSRFVLKESVPSCKYVLPEQYNLFKKHSEDYESKSQEITLINKDNYTLYYLSFIVVLILYILILIVKSI